MLNTQNHQEVAMLRDEVEMLMRERDTLLRVTGAAAAFVAEIDSASLATETLQAAEMLAESLNHLSEDTLRESLEAVKAHIDALA
ncbi:hypothetical protein TPL01_03870 [Sulfuriferula plumbiphila]|uniref:Uncharacterized protein n=1 Tax=Sulfuriferula plumbiphila TaxID=171865 RepID=A0A512L450_9PROT|nr:hypothetical protein [Sulfuriferula plumbiphila]BBP05454.1 hypothetical protein SFPGR_28760 [Sulfuriferula plumbiphila]GEP29249.1 hypothetical protein TPL01_03870 [Sulfuriferula plumbiphila]